jgi:hypothetical protein
MKSLRNNLWLWGQTPNSHHAGGIYQLPGNNHMTATEGCEFFGISNCCRVAMGTGPFPPFDEESRQLAHLNQVVWSIIGAGGVRRNEDRNGDLEEVIRQARHFPNINGAVLDDFFSERRIALYPPERIAEIRRRLNEGSERSMDLWIVWYDREIDVPVQPYLEICDVITYWTWYGKNLDRLEEYLDRMIAATPGKRRLVGCYLWNYGEKCPLSPQQMQHQLDVYLKYLRAGLLEGMILCSNCCADIGLHTVDQVKAWIDYHGDEIIG